jgi:hypothetical protein
MDSDHVRKYRTSTLGSSLAEALQDLIDEERLTKKDAQTIFGVFDKVRPMSLVRNDRVYMIFT